MIEHTLGYAILKKIVQTIVKNYTYNVKNASACNQNF